jgi:ribosomal protein S18 acetylase RimI-like enzyme
MTDRDAEERAAKPSVQVASASVDEPGIAELLAFAVGDGDERLSQAVQRYRDEPTTTLLVATIGQHPVAVLGYTVTDFQATVLHVATAPRLRGAGIGTSLLKALRRMVSADLTIVAETDAEAVDFYRSNGFEIASLGEKYPGVKRFHVTLDPIVDDGNRGAAKYVGITAGLDAVELG